MHTIPVTTNAGVSPGSTLDFVWLELTNRCNLHCVHCYAESGPKAGDKDLLSEQNYLDLIEQVYDLGCRKIQFIGGEPTLNRSLPVLIEAAYDHGFEFIEVFTNLTRLSDALLEVFCRFNVAVATSFYSHNPSTHEAVTRQRGSFELTTRNMRRILDAGLTLRAGIIEMDQNREDLVETWAFLERMGIKNIGRDHLRAIGRAEGAGCSGMEELCGSCAGNILSIGPDGVVAPCNMSKRWSVGSILKTDLAEIVSSEKLLQVRKQIEEVVGERTELQREAICDPKTCNPYSSCCPSTQSCLPCEPNGCNPCYPKG
ncbi:MAG TPA: radical SAM protein [Pyrinomonadaceae bacterium]|nr:radical SAM protein [Pyrinomonadaceae bacterium]